jgi:hypothetical protein
MNISTKAIRCLFVLIGLSCAVVFNASAQNVNSLSLSSAGDTARWDTVLVGEKPTGNNVTVMAGDTVSLDDSATCARLSIQKGAILNSLSNAANGDAYILQTGTGTAPTPDTLDNEGVFGSASGTNDGIALAIPASSSALKLMGGGTTAIGLIRPAQYNAALVFDAAQDLSLNYNGIAFSALPLVDSNSTTNKIIFNVDTGKTLTIINPHGQFQGDPGVYGGNYTYNIYGTLDLTATKDTQQVVPDYANSISAASVTTVNISGKWNLGLGFNPAKSGAPTSGTIIFNILAGGVVDATKTSVLSTGTSYFTTNGSGVFIRRVDNTGETFPVGATGSSTFSPITLTNSGTAINFSVSVKNRFDNPVPNSNNVVNKQWTITADSSGVSDIVVSPGWITGDQAAGFSTARSISVIRYNGSDWAASNATLSGLGTAANPYAATAGGFSTFGIFAVENSPVNTDGLTQLSVYPNPVSSDFTVIFPTLHSGGTLGIASISGQKMYSTPLSSGSASWNGNISNWASGVYILTLQQGGKRASVKLIKL